MANLLYSDNGDGTASLNGLYKDDKGNVLKVPANATIATGTKKTVSVAEAQSAGLLYNQKQNTMTIKTNAVNIAETASGSAKTVRTEVQSIGGGIDVALNLKMAVSPASMETQQVIVIGDGAQNIQLLKGYPAFADTAIDGTFGVNTLTFINNRFKAGQAARYHGLQISAFDSTGAPASDVFTSSLIQLAKVDLQNGTITLQPINWEMTQDGSQFNQNQRLLRNFRTIIGPDTAIIITIPRGRTISLNTDQRSVSAAYDMELLNSM